ncbi:MAG TPA: polysaccharide deacetylase family protein [Firmicutes bacterium]|nr:polysaccharide deacetylase family protein [Bacillota bacterium]
MKLVIVERKKVTWFVCWALLVVISAVAVTQWSALQRKWYGVKDGVMLEGRSMARLLPAEVKKVVTEMAKFYTLPPQNAGYFVETGEVIPDKEGRGVDIEATVGQILTAQPGAQLRMITFAIPASVGKDYFSPVFQGPADQKKASLTINVAWGEEELPALLQILKKRGVKATFFFDGAWVKKFPEFVKEIHTAGHEIANHGLYHGHPAQMGREELKRLIVENDQLLAGVIGAEPAKLFAPPYGEFNEEIVAVAGNLGYRTIMWTIDTIDWQRPAPEVIIRRVVDKMKGGAIILMHPTAPTVQALDRIIQALQGQGYELVTVSELLRKAST